jgi:hypothetical protein
MTGGRDIEKRTQLPTEELAPAALRLRLEALLQEAFAALSELSEFNKTELVQSVIYPTRSLQSLLEGETETKSGWTFQLIFLEERFDRKYRPKGHGKKKPE